MLSSAESKSQNVPAFLFSDPSFRRDLTADPVGTLASHGIEVKQSDLPAEIRLPEFGDSLPQVANPGNGNGNGNGSENGNGGPPPTSEAWLWFMFVG